MSSLSMVDGPQVDIPIENKWKQQGIIGMVHLGDKIYFVMQYKSNAIHMHPFHNSKIAVDIT